MADTAGAIARALGVSVRRVQALYVEGMPRTVRAAQRWHDEKKRQRESARSKTLEDARRRKTEAEAELAEIELATARGELVPVAEAEAAVAALLDGLRARLTAAPGKHAPAVVGLRTPAEALVALQAVIEDVMGELSA